MDEKRIEQLYKLLERAERERDHEAAAALRWAIYTLESRGETMEPTKVRVWKAPAEAEARYVTVTNDGQLIDAWGTLAEIRKRYKVQIELGHVELVRELDKVYVPKNTSYKK